MGLVSSDFSEKETITLDYWEELGMQPDSHYTLGPIHRRSYDTERLEYFVQVPHPITEELWWVLVFSRKNDGDVIVYYQRINSDEKDYTHKFEADDWKDIIFYEDQSESAKSVDQTSKSSMMPLAASKPLKGSPRNS